MIIGIMGDTHYTNRGPSKRLDDFFATQLAKTAEAFKIFADNKCGVIFQPGDLFDGPTAANKVKAALIHLFKEHHVKLYCVAGQHDITGHSLGTLPNSPLAVMEAAGAIEMLKSEVTRIRPPTLRASRDYEELNCYGASFGSEVPVPKYPDAYNVLVIHAMIGNRELFPGQQLVSPRNFLKRHPTYDLVVAGDYHFSFHAAHGAGTIINAGCLVRKTISTFDLEHKPSVYIFDTIECQMQKFPLTVLPPEEAFDLTRPNTQSEFDVSPFLNSILQATKGSTKKGEDITKRTLQQLFKEKDTPQEVQDMIDDCFEEIQHERTH